MYYIVGLGNPGEQYACSRHNVGRIVVDRLRTELSCGAWEVSTGASARYTRGEIDGVPIQLLLPETYMNRSGETLQYIAEKHGAAPEDFIVVYDDVDLPFGALRIAAGGGAGSHNGMRSVINHLHSTECVRVRIGIAPTSFWTGKTKRPQGGGALERFVLGRMSRSEQAKLDMRMADIHDAIEMIVTRGVKEAMNEWN